MKSFFMALQFLSRLTVVKQTTWSDADFGRSVVWFPLVGTLLGAVLCLLYHALGYVFSGLLLSLLVTAAWFWLTGGLHADGYMDTADGIFSGRSRERMLVIMKDSRVGANGVIAFFFLAAFKLVSINTIAPAALPYVLLSVPTAARYGTLISIFCFPYARETGLGRTFALYGPSYPLVRALIPALLPIVFVGPAHLLYLGGAVLISLLANRQLVRLLGGTTGDTYGAVLEFTELLLLLAAAA